MRRVPVTICLLAFVLVVAVEAAVGQTGANATWHVQKYDLNVTLPDSGRAVPIKAALTITNVSSGPAGTLTLRISPLAEVTSVKINDAVADFSKSEEKISAATSLQRIG